MTARSVRNTKRRLARRFTASYKIDSGQILISWGGRQCPFRQLFTSDKPTHRPHPANTSMNQKPKGSRHFYFRACLFLNNWQRVEFAIPISSYLDGEKWISRHLGITQPHQLCNISLKELDYIPRLHAHRFRSTLNPISYSDGAKVWAYWMVTKLTAGELTRDNVVGPNKPNVIYQPDSSS